MAILSKQNRLKIPLAGAAIIIILSFSLTGCSAGKSSAEDELAMAPMAGMPAEVKAAPVSVREAYQFAIANPDVLKNLPCFCGCGAMGHTSNYSCYVQSSEGKDIVFETHALGCGICVDITRDAMRMLREGKAMTDIRAAIDAQYSQYGPSNMP